ncbi:hypothetical protein Dimus_020932, partial [Dionaea muscipula]
NLESLAAVVKELRRDLPHHSHHLLLLGCCCSLITFNRGIGGLVLDTVGHFISRKYHNRVIKQEADHCLIAYLLGVLSRGCILLSLDALQKEGSLNVQAGTSFVDTEFLEEVNMGKVTAMTLNRFSCVALAGVTTEYLLYGYAEGSLADISKEPNEGCVCGGNSKNASTDQVRLEQVSLEQVSLEQDGGNDGDLPVAPEKAAPSVNATEVIEDTNDDDDVVDSGGHAFDNAQEFDDEQHDGRDDAGRHEIVEPTGEEVVADAHQDEEEKV